MSRACGAQQSLTDAKERVFVVHEFELGEELQRALLSTNAIENVMRNLRAHGHGVKRWRTEGAMVSRWMASGLFGTKVQPLSSLHSARMTRLIQPTRDSRRAAPYDPVPQTSIAEQAAAENRPKVRFLTTIS
jgi:hypothetical protein